MASWVNYHGCPDSSNQDVTGASVARITYIALGNSDSSQVCYVLHRYFVQRHEWNIEGLDRAADNQEKSSAAAILLGRVPGFIRERFEEAFGSSGLKLHELAIVAATLEHSIHDEATERLKGL